MMQLGFLWDGLRPSSHADTSAEPDAELITAAEQTALVESLRQAGHAVEVIEGVAALLAHGREYRDRLDLVFNMSLGCDGVERKLTAPAVLQAIGLPYTGSSPYVQALTRHKLHAKLVVAAAGLATPPAMLYEGAAAALARITYPAIVKPLAGSASAGIDEHSVVANAVEAAAQAERLWRQGATPTLIETFIAGLELEVPILCDPQPRSLGVVVITQHGAAIDGQQLLDARTVAEERYAFTQELSRGDRATIETAAVCAATALGVRDYCRIDFRLDTAGVPWFIEANTHPHLLPHSSFSCLATTRHTTQAEMLDAIVRVAARRYGLATS